MSEKMKLSSNLLPDPSWGSLYKLGGLCAFLYVVLALFVPFFLYINHAEYSYMVDGSKILGLIEQNGIIWWVTLQTLVLGTSFFAIITFTALYMSLKNVDKVNALVGAITAVVIHILFIAYYPVMLALGFLSRAHEGSSEAKQRSFEIAAESLLAINNAFNPLYESVFAISILFLSLAMLKSFFGKKLAIVGFFTTASAFVALALWPIVGIGYFWWWVFFIIWFTFIGLKLYQAG